MHRLARAWGRREKIPPLTPRIAGEDKEVGIKIYGMVAGVIPHRWRQFKRGNRNGLLVNFGHDPKLEPGADRALIFVWFV
jgi:hypothetical protein